MTQETIVAAFETASQAQDAAAAIEAAGIPSANISKHATATPNQGLVSDQDNGSLGGSFGTPAKKEAGFWSKLFGTADDDYTYDTASRHDHTVYDRTMASGGAVLSITIANAERDGERVISILENYNPIDIEERIASYDRQASAAGTGVAESQSVLNDGTSNQDQTIQLAEEELVVGKRVLNQGTTRIRRYVVETPVSEDIALRDETVTVDRRPMSRTEAVAADAFTEKTIAVTELKEEAVVGKTAHVVEEVVIRKNINDRVETVRDTVRREELEVDKVDETAEGPQVLK